MIKVGEIVGRGKKKRRQKQAQKRKDKLKLGKQVPFDLANSPRKLNGIRNKYNYKSNMHNLIYKDAYFENVKYQASIITDCNFKNTKLRGVDFYNSNLKRTSFKGASLNNVIFFNCNLKGTDFKNVKFKNVFFMSTSIEVAKNFDQSGSITIITHYPKLEISERLKRTLTELSNCEKIYKGRVLHVNKNKWNHWNIKLLLDEYGKDLEKALYALIRRKNKWGFNTLYSYKRFIDCYLKRW
jgi:hypothetical protein